MATLADSREATSHVITRGRTRSEAAATVIEGSASTSTSSVGDSMSVVADGNSGAGSRRAVTRGRQKSNAASTPKQDSVPTSTPSDVDQTPDTKDLRRMFNKVYNKWSRSERVDKEDMAAITSVYVSEENFMRLTRSRELAKYIALIDYRIRFDELPGKPHGEVAGYMNNYLGEIFQSTSPAGVLFPASDNGMTFSILSSL